MRRGSRRQTARISLGSALPWRWSTIFLSGNIGYFPSVRVTGFNGQELPTWPRHDSTKAKLEAAVFDRDGDLGAQLSALAPTVVVDVSGPFQAYGAPRYRLIAEV